MCCGGDTLTQKDKDDAQKDFNDSDNDKFKNGPLQERSCTDVFMCLLFIAFIVIMVGISAVGFSKGDPYKIVTPFDENANICGRDEGFEDYKYLFWPEILGNWGLPS
jgi:hypothetical protein